MQINTKKSIYFNAFENVEQEYFDTLKFAWQKTLPSFSLRELTYLFPDASREIKKLATQKKNFHKKESERWVAFRRRVGGIQSKNIAMDKVVRICAEAIAEYHAREMKSLQRFITVKPRVSGEGTLDIEKAKQVPVNNFIQFRGGFARCLWHNDKNPSMHYYKKLNRVKCFSCGKGGDVIDVVQKLHSCSFEEAVRRLSN
jgi:hypothetical protein